MKSAPQQPYAPSLSLYPPAQRCPSRQTGAIVTRHYDGGLNPFDALATQREAVRRASPLSVSALTTDLMESEEQKVKRHRIIPMSLALETEYWHNRLDKHRVKKEKEKQQLLRIKRAMSAGEVDDDGDGDEENRQMMLAANEEMKTDLEASLKFGDSLRPPQSLTARTSRQHRPHQQLQQQQRKEKETLQRNRDRDREKRRLSQVRTGRLLSSAGRNEFAGIKLSSNEQGVRGMQHAKPSHILNYIANPYAEAVASSSKGAEQNKTKYESDTGAASAKPPIQQRTQENTRKGRTNSKNNSNPTDKTDRRANGTSSSDTAHDVDEDDEDDDGIFSHESSAAPAGTSTSGSHHNQQHQKPTFDLDDAKNQALLFSSTKSTHLGNNHMATSLTSAAASVRRLQDDDNRKREEKMRLRRARQEHAQRKKSFFDTSAATGAFGAGDRETSYAASPPQVVTSATFDSVNGVTVNSVSSVTEVPAGNLFASVSAPVADRERGVEISRDGSFVKLPPILRKTLSARIDNSQHDDSPNCTALANFTRNSSSNNIRASSGVLLNNSNSATTAVANSTRSGSEQQQSQQQLPQPLSVKASSTSASVLPLHREQTDKKIQARQETRHVSDFYRHLLPADVKYRARATHSMILKQARQEVLKRNCRKAADDMYGSSGEPQSKMDVLIGRIMHLHNSTNTSGSSSSSAVNNNDSGNTNNVIPATSSTNALIQLNLHTQSRYVTQHAERQQQKSYYGITLTDVRMMRDEFVEKSDLAYLQILQTKIPNSLGERLVDAKMVKAALSKAENGVDLTFENLFRAAYGGGARCLPVSAMNHLLAELREEEQMRAQHHPYSFRRFVTVGTAKDIENSFNAILHFLQPMERVRVSQFGDVGITEEEYCAYMRRASTVMVTAEQAAKLFRSVATEQYVGGGGGGGDDNHRSSRAGDGRRGSVVVSLPSGPGVGGARRRSIPTLSRLSSFARKGSGVGGGDDRWTSSNHLQHQRVDARGGDISSDDAETIPSSEDEEEILKKKKDEERRRNFEQLIPQLKNVKHGGGGGQSKSTNVNQEVDHEDDAVDDGAVDDDDEDEEIGDVVVDHRDRHHHEDEVVSSGRDEDGGNGGGDADDDKARRSDIGKSSTALVANTHPSGQASTQKPTSSKRDTGGGSAQKKSSAVGKLRLDPSKRRRRIRRKKIITVEEWALLILPNLKEKVAGLKKLHAEQAEKESIFQVGGIYPSSTSPFSTNPAQSQLQQQQLLSSSLSTLGRRGTNVGFQQTQPSTEQHHLDRHSHQHNRVVSFRV